MFLPDWIIEWLAIAAGVSVILRAYRIAGLLAFPVFVRWVAWPTAKPFYDSIPEWQKFLIIALVGLIVLQGLIRLVFGREATGHFTGTMLVRLFDLVFFGPFRSIRKVILRHFR